MNKRVRFLVVAVLAGTCGAGLAYLFDDGDELPVEMSGYYKTEANDRVIAFRSDRALSEDEAQQVFDGVSVTAGALTRAVIYTDSDDVAPNDALTFAGSLQAALALTVTDPFDRWNWMMQVNPAGERSIKGN